MEAYLKFTRQMLKKCLGQHRTIPNVRMRRQIFRQIKQKEEGILGVFPSIVVKYGGKYASRRVLEAQAANCAVLP
jgi:hypothetical protein